MSHLASGQALPFHVEQLTTARIGDIPPGRFVLCHDDKNLLQIYGTVKIDDSPTPRIVGLTGNGAFRIHHHVKDERALVLPWDSSQFRIHVRPGARRTPEHTRIGRLVIQENAPPFFVATWSGPGEHQQILERVCLKTWTVESIRIPSFGVDEWSASLIDQDETHHLFALELT